MNWLILAVSASSSYATGPSADVPGKTASDVAQTLIYWQVGSCIVIFFLLLAIAVMAGVIHSYSKMIKKLQSEDKK